MTESATSKREFPQPDRRAIIDRYLKHDLVRQEVDSSVMRAALSRWATEDKKQ